MSDGEIDELLLNFNKCDIFTPESISKIMASYLSNSGNLLEPAVGSGNLLKYVDLSKYNNIDIYDIKKEYLDKCPNCKNVNKFHKDFIKSNIKTKYKNIILNPPFIKIQNISIDYVKYIKKKWNTINTGSIDLYYAFLIKCLELLDDDGVMISVTPNSYLFNKSAIKLRKMLIDNKLVHKIIDYKSKKIFNNASVYCCVTIFTKKNKKSMIFNDNIIEYHNIMKLSNKFSVFNFIENNSKCLNDICTIKNGIATLRDKIYIHDTKLFDEPCWKPITNSKEQKYIIFPYDDNGKIIDEDILKRENPNTYQYLEKNKEELAKRDKGNKKYPKWYSFGRTQSLIKPKCESVIIIPVFIDPININFKKCKSSLNYSSLCIEPKNGYELNKIIEAIKKNIDFIISNSSKRDRGWINLSGSVLKQIPI